MKNLLVVFIIVVISLSIVAVADKNNVVWNSIQNLQQQINALNSQMSLATKVRIKHVTLNDGPCYDINENITEVGWCPDEQKDIFTIEDKDYVPGKTTMLAQVINPTDPVIHKMTNCIIRVVLTYENMPPLLRIICEAQPLNDAQLAYTLFYPQMSVTAARV